MVAIGGVVVAVADVVVVVVAVAYAATTDAAATSKHISFHFYNQEDKISNIHSYCN